MKLTNLNLFTNKKRGFTLIEILLVLTLLGIVVSLVGKRIFSSFNSGKRKATMLAIRQIEGALDAYRIDCNFYPTTDQGLKALVSAPEVGRKCAAYNPNGYATKKTLIDPFGTEFTYTCEDGQNYEIKSLGADGVPDGEGDNADISSKEE